MHTHRRLRARLRTLALFGVVVVAGLGVATTPAWSETTSDDIAFDSELTLHERNDFGSYTDYFIALTIKDGAATLSLNKDGRKATVSVALDECQAMWQRLIESGLETLTDTPEETFPDQSHFTIQYRVIDRDGGFLIHAVDDLSDTRYRYIVEEILSMGNSYLEQSTEGEEQ